MRGTSASAEDVQERIHTPPSDAGLVAALGIADGLQALSVRSRDLREAIEREFGLRLGQVRALHAIREHDGTITSVANATGDHPDATLATVRTLQELGLAELTPAPTGGTATARLTEAGRTRLDQLLALHMRLAAHLADDAPDPAS